MDFNLTENNNRSNRLVVLFCLMSLAIVGFWLRVHNLGELGLLGDEGHQALAVDGILLYGYPVNPSGGTYFRSLPYSYSQALSALFLGINEFSIRLPSVLFGLLCIIVVFYLGKSLFNTGTALLSAFILTFSVWEIELSRYGRMYTGLQFFYLLSLYAFYQGFFKGRKKNPLVSTAFNSNFVRYTSNRHNSVGHLRYSFFFKII